MSRKLIYLVCSLSLFLLSHGTLTAQAQMHFSPPHGGEQMRGGGLGFMFPMMFLKKLDLTPEQEARIRKIMAAHRGSLRSLFERLEAAHDQLSTKFLTPGGLAPSDLAPQTQKVNQLREELMKEGLKTALEIRDVLTSEQLVTAARLQEKMRGIRAEMRQLLGDGE